MLCCRCFSPSLKTVSPRKSGIGIYNISLIYADIPNLYETEMPKRRTLLEVNTVVGQEIKAKKTEHV
jgi:hypothetical protein